jgi:hypothetical protein
MVSPRMRQRQQNTSVVGACVLALTVLLAACSGSELAQNLGAAVSDSPQPDYRRIVATNISSIFSSKTDVSDLEISGARLVDHLKGPAWLTCLKLDAHGKAQEYAVFIQGDKIIDTRAGVLMDQCYKENYQPFAASAAKKPGRTSEPPH